MRRLSIVLILVLMPLAAAAQTDQRPRVVRSMRGPGPATAEGAVKQSMQRLGEIKKDFDRDFLIVGHLRAADAALTDPMQPSNAVQKAYEEVDAAKLISVDFVVTQGITHAEEEIDNARRSPGSADFGRLRSILRSEATTLALRLLLRRTADLEDETFAWIHVQQMISDHLQNLSEITSQAVRTLE
ncbi:MAG TPA: hypothetical protein VKH35_02400 [Thermoanaerobaculia bacterium]|jgi:hypothetical protein|nr:hypothetical protein [Thermoanaerobaculia bacterium]